MLRPIPNFGRDAGTVQEYPFHIGAVLLDQGRTVRADDVGAPEILPERPVEPLTPTQELAFATIRERMKTRGARGGRRG